jgi:inositol oxygenase
MTIWEAMTKLNTLIDDSDPDTSLSQIEHLLQTAEAIRRDGKPRWMQVTGLIHDLGKLLVFYGAEGQWDVVGDTFPVGCAFDERIILPDMFVNNPDYGHAIYGTENGIYYPGIGLDNVMLSWGHDEYLYHVVKDQSTLPPEALAMIRYHSFYAWHSQGAYRQFMDGHDVAMLRAVQEFNPYDLYSKAHDIPSIDELKVRPDTFSFLISKTLNHVVLTPVAAILRGAHRRVLPAARDQVVRQPSPKKSIAFLPPRPSIDILDIRFNITPAMPVAFHNLSPIACMRDFKDDWGGGNQRQNVLSSMEETR